jgi:hypothetical protein
MTSMSNKSMSLAEFARLLDVYGAERTRWPVEARAAAAHLIATDAEARRTLAEAEALDRLLKRAPVPGVAFEAALAERIVAAAQRSPRIVRLPGAQRAAVSAPEPASTPNPSVTAVGRGRGRLGLFSREVGAAGLLAASLIVGVVIGSSSLPTQVLPGLAEMAGLAPDRDDLVKIALYEEVMQ